MGLSPVSYPSYKSSTSLRYLDQFPRPTELSSLEFVFVYPENVPFHVIFMMIHLLGLTFARQNNYYRLLFFIPPHFPLIGVQSAFSAWFLDTPAT